MSALLGRISRAVDRGARLFMQVALAIIVVLVISEVAARNVFDHSLTWVEEVAVTYLGTWLVFIGASHAMKIGMLVSFDFFVARLGRRGAAVAFSISQLSMLTFLGVVIVYGIKLVAATMSQPSPALQLPIGLAYLGIVVGCSIMALHCVSAILERFGGKAPQ